MAEAAKSIGKSFNGYTIGSGPSSGRSGVQYMDPDTALVLDMLHSGGVTANNNKNFGDYGLKQAARPRDNLEYGGPLEGLLNELEPANNNVAFQSGIQYALNAILGSEDQALNNNNNYSLVSSSPRAHISRGYGPVVATNNNNHYNTSQGHDAIAHPFGELERMMSGVANMPRGSALEFTEVRRSLRIVRF